MIWPHFTSMNILLLFSIYYIDKVTLASLLFLEYNKALDAFVLTILSAWDALLPDIYIDNPLTYIKPSQWCLHPDYPTQKCNPLPTTLEFQIHPNLLYCTGKCTHFYLTYYRTYLYVLLIIYCLDSLTMVGILYTHITYIYILCI